METRKIKFRAWERIEKHFIYFELFHGTTRHTPTIYPWAEPEIWQQFTGLLDKNGKEIYEGDIMKWDWALGGEIQTIVEVIDDLNTAFGFVDSEETETWEVIGNINENPDLLTE